MSKKDKKEDGKEKIKFSSLFKYLKYSYKYAKQEKKYLFLVLIANIILTIISIAVPIFGAKQIVSLTGGEWNKLIFLNFSIFQEQI